MTITLKIGGATTGRRFTDPIRYFKANDPYYWEVDNIPLKQLQENIRYVNDRLNTAIVSGNLDTSRSDIAELKPFVNNADDKIRVKPGRYTARINNAHDIDRLDSFIRQASSDVAGNYTNYAWQDSTNLDALIARVQSAVGIDALNLNGLSERVFAQLARSPDEVVDSGDEESGYPRTTLPLPSTEAITQTGNHYYADAFPISEYLGWFKHVLGFVPGVQGSALFKTTTQANLDPNKLLNLPILENALIKYWRGTARTAVVDVPEELNIAIPAFDEDDFPVAGATSRIDLVFIYSKPVDTSAVTIGKYEVGGTGRTRAKITEPILGVLKGAGLGVDTSRFGNSEVLDDAEGTSQMLASVADQNNTDNGFKIGPNQTVAIHGSFPSPEDLMNIAPLLSEQLEEDSWFLTGQTIFPVAYVKVNKQPGVNVQGNQVITDDDVVDIRPLFRTAELTYNERAGIAAAVPPLSLANRAVGRYELEYEINNLHEDHDARLTRLETESISFNTEHRYFLTGNYGRGGKQIFSTRPTTGSTGTLSCKTNLDTMIGPKSNPTTYDLAAHIHPGVTTIDRVKSVFLNIEARHVVGARDPREVPPTIWINAISPESSTGNQAMANGVTSRWSDRPIIQHGHGVRGTNVYFINSGFHSFELPVEWDGDDKLDIYVWYGGEHENTVLQNPHPDFGIYYTVTMHGYCYTKSNTINIV